jgi:hypothetical protein
MTGMPRGPGPGPEERACAGHSSTSLDPQRLRPWSTATLGAAIGGGAGGVVGALLGGAANPRGFAGPALVLGLFWAAVGVSAALWTRHRLLRNRQRRKATARGAARGAWAAPVSAGVLLFALALYFDALSAFGPASGHRRSGGVTAGALLVVGALLHAPLGAVVGAAVAWRAQRAG